jgi:hypothetical protein
MEHQDQEHEQELQIRWRRDKVQELCSEGYSQREISQTLQVGLATLPKDFIAYPMLQKLVTIFLPSS